MFYGLNDNIWPILLCPTFVMVLKANFITLARCLKQFLVSKASANKWIRNVWTSAQLTDTENKNEKGLFLSLQTCCVCLQRICFLFDSNYENSNSLKKCCFELEQNPLFNGKICASELFSPVKSRVDWEFWFIDRNISFSFFWLTLKEILLCQVTEEK